MSTINRINEIIAAVDSVEVLADVGCDHGFLGKRCLVENLAQMVVFTDISQKCLDKAIILMSQSKLLNRSKFANCSGVELVLNFDAAIIAGMGGDNIINIIKKDYDKFQSAKYTILQPMSDLPKVRKYLTDNNFNLTLDRVFKGRRWYHLLKIKSGKMQLNEGQIMFGADERQYLEKQYLAYLFDEKTKWKERLNKNNNEKVNNIMKILEEHLQFIRSRNLC